MFKKFKVVEEDYDMWGNKLVWKPCVKCKGLVFTSTKEDSKVLCGAGYCIQEKEAKVYESVRKAAIPDGIRWEVWERDNFTCQHCGSRKNLSVDHIFPESKGGTLELSNLQTLCKRCNSRKGAR